MSKTIPTLFVLIIFVLFTGCIGGSIRSSGFVPEHLRSQNPIIGMASDYPLSDALSTELLGYGFIIIERARLAHIMKEHGLSFTGILEKDNAELLGKVLNIDMLIFVTMIRATSFSDRIQSATIKVVDIKTGRLTSAVNYENGRGGGAGSPADSMMKETLLGSAQAIAQELAKNFGLN